MSYPQPIEGETNRTYIDALTNEIIAHVELRLAIEDHLGLHLKRVPDFFMYYEYIKGKIKKKQDLLKEILEHDTCLSCGDLVITWYEPKYKGYMGRCDKCKSSWRES